MTRPVLIVFTRVPRLGVGKRRLARAIGDRGALRAARGMLHTLLRRLRGLRGIDLVIATTPDRNVRFHAPGFARIGQKQGDLGARMHRAMRRFPQRPVVIIGSDIPDVGADDIRLALRLLRGNDAVFGPATDGGYWLIGVVGKRQDALFAGVRWSSAHALADTQRNLRHRRVAMLRELADVDEITPVRFKPD